jgi:hypothetical protein
MRKASVARDRLLKDGSTMSFSQSGLEALILGIPAVGILLTSFFRLDVLLAKSNNNSRIGHPLSHVDEEGSLVCIEPDGRYSVPDRTPGGLAVRRPGHLPRRGGAKAVRRVSVKWEEGVAGE